MYKELWASRSIYTDYDPPEYVGSRGDETARLPLFESSRDNPINHVMERCQRGALPTTAYKYDNYKRG